MRPPPPISQVHRFPVTAGTGLLAIGVTLAWWSKVDISALMMDGHVREWQLWRLLTSTLPHINFFHLAFNLYWLWVFGTLAESVFGQIRTAALFVILAVGSMGAEFTILSGGVGLSGVGYGLFGLMWVLSRHDQRFEGAVDENTAATFVAWFLICIVTTWLGVMPVANIAHGVGAVLGALIGAAIIAPTPERKTAIRMLITVFIASAIIGATEARGLVNLSRDSVFEATLCYDALIAHRDHEAVRWGAEAVHIEPRAPGAWYNLGIAYQRIGNPQLAADAYARAKALAPNDPTLGGATKPQQ